MPVKWPVYKDKLVVVGDPKGSVGIVTCWTDREVLARQLSHPQIAAWGNLYSPNRGLDYLIANVLAHPHLQHLVIGGFDRLGGGLALLKLVTDGFSAGKDNTGRECWLVNGVENGRVSKDFSAEDLEAFRQTVVVYDQRWQSPGQKAESFVIWLSELTGGLAPFAEKVREPKIVTVTEVSASKSFPHLGVGQTIVGRTVAEVWVKLLDFIMKFGLVSNTQYQSIQQEHLVLTSIITEEDPVILLIPNWFPFSREEFLGYLPTVTDAIPVPAGVSYYYGDRMRIRHGDQIAKLVEKLKTSPETRQGVIQLWDQETDILIKDPPCLNHLWVRVQDGRLCLHAVIRSNDMFRAYPANALALRMLQEKIRQESSPELSLGPLVITSESAHIYDESWEAAGRIVEQYRKEVVADQRNIVDPAGIWLISVETGEILAQHLLPSGEEVQQFHGRTAMQLYLQMQEFVSLTEHALYLGAELQKAETALKFGLEYTQDKPLR